MVYSKLKTELIHIELVVSCMDFSIRVFDMNSFSEQTNIETKPSKNLFLPKQSRKSSKSLFEAIFSPVYNIQFPAIKI